MRHVTMLTLFLTACTSEGVHTASRKPPAEPLDTGEVLQGGTVEAPSTAPGAYTGIPVAHLRCATRFDITLPDGTLGGSFCAFGIMANGRDRTCLLDENMGTVVCL